jgi:chromosomal replication initiation ATPase DnaA
LCNTVLDLEALEGLPSAQEEPLFHLMNNLRAAGFSLLILARQAPARWTVRLPDLASRLRAVLAVQIGEGDQAFLEHLLVALAAQFELDMRPEARAYLAQRLPRQAEACLGLVEILAGRARVVTVPQARAALEDWQALAQPD